MTTPEARAGETANHFLYLRRCEGTYEAAAFAMLLW